MTNKSCFVIRKYLNAVIGIFYVFLSGTSLSCFNSPTKSDHTPRVRPFFSWKFLNAINDTASINDTISIIINYNNTTRKQVKLSWYIDNKELIYSTSRISNLSGADTITYFSTTAKKCTIYISMLDEADSIWWDSSAFHFIQDIPNVFAGNDTIVPADQKFTLHGTAMQKFGTINRWQWKLDTGNWNTTSGPDTTILLPDREGLYLCSLSVIDDDGNLNSDDIKLYALFPGFAAGGGHSLFLSPYGTVWTCGMNNRGQLGDGETSTRLIPYKILDNVIKIDASVSVSFFLKMDGSVWGCGGNNYATLGDGTSIDRGSPVQILTNIKDISAGELHSLFLKTDGTLWGCGTNHLGQLGDGTQLQRKTPVQIISDVKSMVASEYCHSLILKNDNSLWACGLNNFGLVGDGTTSNKNSPLKVMTDVAAIDAGLNFSMILKTDNSLWSCGWNEYGQLGDGTTISNSTPAHIMDDVNKIACGKYHSLIIKNDESLWAFGQIEYDGQGNPKPVQIMTDVQNATAGTGFNLVLKTDGTLWTFGKNQYGQLGDGATADNFTPKQIQIPWK